MVSGTRERADTGAAAETTQPVRFRWTDRPGRKVELLGDLPSWKRPHPMPEIAPGRYECVLRLSPGRYRYKLRLDDHEWRVDPEATAIDPVDGFDNGERVVGGTAPPLHFAPDRRHVQRSGDRLVVHAELSGEGRPPALWLDVGGGREHTALEPVVEVAGRRLLRAELALDAAAEGRFGFDDQREDFALPAPVEVHRPAWLEQATLYAIFLDRWHRGRDSAPDARAGGRDAPSTPLTWYGGDLDGVREHLDHVAGLGVDAIVLTPLHLSDSPHRYDALDLLSVDPRIGGEAALARLLDAAHARSLKVIVDLSITHLHADHPAFVDLLARQQDSEYADWFRVRRWPVTRLDGASYEHYFAMPSLPWLALERAAPRAHVLDAARRWVERGVDGLRLDAMDEAPFELWSELRAELRRLNPDLALIGEVVVDRIDPFVEDRGADTATDFRLRDLLVDLIATRQITPAEFVHRLSVARHRLGPFPPVQHLVFLDNHDLARFRSLCIHHDRLRAALALLAFGPEPLWITQGTELGQAGGSPAHAREGVWRDRPPMPPLPAPPTRTGAWIRSWTGLRRGLLAGAGPVRVVHADARQLVLARRIADGGAVHLALSVSDQPLEPALPPSGEPVLDLHESSRKSGMPLAPGGVRLVRLRPDP